jgi:MFS family permease
MRAALSLTDNEMSLLQGPALVLPSALLAIPLGALVDRLSRKRLLVLFALMNILGTAATASARSLTALLVARCVVGLMAFATAVAAISLISDLYAADERGFSTMVATIGEVLGIAAAYALGGIFLERFHANGAGWAEAMWSFAAVLAFALFAAWQLREPVRTNCATTDHHHIHPWRVLWKHRRLFAVLVAGKVTVGAAYGAVLTWAAPALQRSFEFSTGHVGALMALSVAVGGVVGPLVGGPLADAGQRTGGPRQTVTLLGLLSLVALPAGAFAAVPNGTAASVLLVIFMVVIGVIGVAEMTVTTVVLPNEIRGLALAVLLAAGLIFGAGLAPLAVSLIAERFEGGRAIANSLAIICMAIGALSCLMFLTTRTCFPSGENGILIQAAEAADQPKAGEQPW